MLVGGTDKKVLEHCSIHYKQTTENTGYMLAAVPSNRWGPPKMLVAKYTIAHRVSLPTLNKVQ